MLMMGIVPAKAYALTYTQTYGAQPQIIWDYLYQQIGNPYAVAAMMGNFARESGLIPNIASIPVTCSFDAWASYTDAVDNGEYDENFAAGVLTYQSDGKKIKEKSGSQVSGSGLYYFVMGLEARAEEIREKDRCFSRCADRRCRFQR